MRSLEPGELLNDEILIEATLEVVRESGEELGRAGRVIDRDLLGDPPVVY
jgi:hypothetical protein